MTEEQLLTAITDAASVLGWRWHHIRRSDKALQMGHPGFPDLVLAKEGRLFCLELKAARGMPTPDQSAWLEALPSAYLIGPEDLNRVISALQWEEDPPPALTRPI